jgi:hypothetical protein
MKYVAEQLRHSICVRPENTLGTCGWINGIPWSARFFKSWRSANAWISKQ